MHELFYMCNLLWCAKSYLLVIVITAECESGNKKLLTLINQSTVKEETEPDFSLLTVLSDAINVGKNLKASLSD